MCGANGDFVSPPSPDSPVPNAEAVDRTLEPRQEHGARTEEGRQLDTSQEFMVDDECEEALDAQYVSAERLEDMANHETKAMSLKSANGSALPPHVRDMALRFIAGFTNLLGLPFEALFQSTALLDMYCQRNARPDMMCRLPATCVALVKMLKKFDNAGMSMKGSNLSVHAGLLSEALRREGIHTDFTTEEMLNEEETSLLLNLDWKLAASTIESWLSAYCARFSIFTKRLMEPSLHWVCKRTKICARLLITHSPASAALPPRRQANGLLGLSFVSARLLPLDAIRPEKLCPTIWEQLFLQIHEQLFLQIQGTTVQQVGVPTCVFPESHARRILELLRVSLGTGMDLKDLQQDCKDVALQLNTALAGTCGAPPPGMSNMGSSMSRIPMSGSPMSNSPTGTVVYARV
eukprot:CAMPEP_0172932492 /NCGR_PEP_ID=MMETSP1075-20121228/220026_1 /TAXON_ID=2916 /ORGANISM="Ceratium fusus, Strain PA161109" /LENGTH=405 /DNA_ID=CAMNT_0013793819 /DNA_START=44 /DNA_END=1261 /DNA_ORIENTATION=+